MPTASAVVDEYLMPNRLRLSQLLADLAGKVEYRLKAIYLPDVALREVVSSSRRIQRLQAGIRGRPENVTFQARIELGELVSAALEQVKTRDAQAILSRVVRHCDASDLLPPRGEDVALSVALLVDESRADDFERDIDDMGNEWQERLTLSLTGPLAPWDFTGMQPR
jgi:Gas vesicle synthesis protein GvpL/GvpF